MKITIENCNNIDFAEIGIEEAKLNIKLAPNGTGKSTIAKAILGSTKEDEMLRLLPFKYRLNNPKNIKPSISGILDSETILCFNEEYLSQFVFKEDELISNSFDIFIRTENYIENEKKIETLVAEIKSLFLNNEELDNFITALKELGGAFKLTQSGISKASTGMKGLSGGNKIQYIPKGLEVYQPFIQNENNVRWIEWQTGGVNFSGISDNCPFCTSLMDESRKELVEKVSKEYDKATIKNLVAIINVFEKLGDYFSDSTKEEIKTLINLKSGLEKKHEEFLRAIKTQIDNFVDTLEKLKALSGFQFKEDENVKEALNDYKLKLDFFDKLNSIKTQKSISPINEKIDMMIMKAGELQGHINQQRQRMKKIIKDRQTEINNFLLYAGYKYKVEILGVDDKSQLKLKHIDCDEHIKGGNQHLSFGERNAFALVLFMYECISKKTGLVILDDPISSFDKNKKYAIIEMLFGSDDNCLKNKTVIMLTHDVEPIIDTISSLSRRYKNKVNASFLKLDNGKVIEKNIIRDDIQTFFEICEDVLNSPLNEIIKLIYMRRNYEITENKGNVYQVLSNLLHKRDTDKLTDSRNESGIMETCDFDLGVMEIEKKIPEFSYSEILKKINNRENLVNLYNTSSNGYEKLQIFRLIGLQNNNAVIQKFINESYHVENDFIYQLAPSKFDMLPQYVIKECDKIIVSL